ncbi:MAG: Rid family hydrolase, partial [Pseudomonadales bacterium]
GGGLGNVVKFNVYLTDLSNFGSVNAVMERVLSKPYPARAVVEVSALPRGAKVEIDAIALLDT